MVAEQWIAGHKDHSTDSHNRIENAYKCLRIVRESLSFNRVADFGCGIGGWLAAAEQLGAKEIQGFEGEWILQAETVILKDRIKIVDLTAAPMKLNKYYDLAISIEVAEHLPEGAADSFVETLVSAADRILFSAALPGQGGLGHINEQPLSYWQKKFWSHNFVPLEVLRPFIAGDRTIYWWLRQNIVMFVAYDVLVRSPNLIQFARPISDFSLQYSAR
jgi:hypothetical protein